MKTFRIVRTYEIKVKDEEHEEDAKMKLNMEVGIGSSHKVSEEIFEKSKRGGE